MRKSASLLSVIGKTCKTPTSGSWVQLLWVQQHQLVKMVMNHTGGHMTIIHIDILLYRETNLQHGHQSCPDAPKQFHQSDRLV